MLGFPKPLWQDDKYAVYQARVEWPLPKGMRCMSFSDPIKAIKCDPRDEFRGIMLRPALTAGYAKYLITEQESNELGEISL